MSKLRLMFVLALGMVVLLSSCQSKPAAPAALPANVQDVPRMTPQELSSLLDAGENVVVVDARSLASYEASHVAGSGSMPYEEIDARYRELPKGARIVFYCT